MASLDPNILAAISHVIQQQMQPYSHQLQKMQQQQMQPDQFGTPLSRSSSGSSGMSRSSSGMSGYSLSSCETPLSRSSSVCSSASSKCSQNKNSSKKKCAKRIFDLASPLSQDRDDVLIPMLQFFDAAYLAPKKSPLFRRQLTKKRKSDGSRKLKKKPDIVSKMFRRLVRVPLTRLLGDVYETDYDLAARYELAAEKIIKRRRSNHVQSWRPDKNNAHLPLKYGGVLGINPVTGIAVVDESCLVAPEPIIVARPKKKKPRGTKQATAPPGKNNQMTRPQQTHNNKPDLNIENMTADFDSDSDNADADTSTPEKNSDDADADTSPPKKKSADMLRCCSSSSCGRKLAPCDIYPKDKGSWAGDSSKRSVWCADCWDDQVRNKLMPLMSERQQKTSEAVAAKQSAQDVKHKKKRNCKCGSTTHSISTHLECPLNKRNLCRRDGDETSTKATKEASRQQKKPTTKEASRQQKARRQQNKSKAKKACKCGSTTHQRTTCLRCPLNLKYRPEDMNEVGWRGSGRGACQDKIRVELVKRGVDVDAVELDHTGDDTDGPPDGYPFCMDAIPASSANTLSLKPAGGDTIPAYTIPAFLPNVGDNVLARFKRKEWYLAQITHIEYKHRKPALFRCYFMDGQVREGVPCEDIQPPSGCSWPKRGEMIGKQFDFDGDNDVSSSRWVVRRMHDDKFFCTRLGDCPLKELNCDDFDIGYVISEYVAQQNHIRQLGPAFTPVQPSTTRASRRR